LRDPEVVRDLWLSYNFLDLPLNLVILCDFDGTVLSIDTCEFVLDRFAQADWRVWDEQLGRGEITLDECLRKQFRRVRVERVSILGQIDQVVSFRPGFNMLVEYSNEHRIPIVLVSAGMDFVIRHILNQKGWLGLVGIYAPKAEVTANGIRFDFPALFDKSSVNFKDDLVRHYRKQGMKVIYIGDGIADYEAAKNADFAFAIKSSKLVELLRRNSIPHREISDFGEVVEVIKDDISVF